MKLKVLWKRMISILLVAVMVLSTGIMNASAAGTDIVTIPDENLKKAIADQLNISYSDINEVQITQEQMESLTSLNASGKGIKDMTGLFTAVNLTSLDLSNNPLGESVKGKSAYNTIFSGLEKLTKLEQLDLSDCDLGEGFSGSYYYPSSLQTALISLQNLVSLDLSYNQIRSYFTLYTALPDLKILDLSGNYFHSFSVTSSQLPSIESINLSNNYIYCDENDTEYTNLVEIGIEKINLSNMRNLADIFQVKVNTPNGSYAAYTADENKYVIDLGELIGDRVTLALTSVQKANTSKATVNGQKYTMGGTGGGTADSIVLENLEAGAHSITVETMHMGGDARTYTLKFTMRPIANEGEESAGIQDTNLQYAICNKLGKASEYSTYMITKADMASLTGTLSVGRVYNTEGLQYATGITTLTLSSGTFTELPDLNALTNLTTLTLASDALAKIPDISALTKLTSINWSGKNLSSLPSLENQTVLTSITYQNIEKITAFPDISKLDKLKTLKIVGCTAATALPSGIENCNALTNISVSGSPAIVYTNVIQNLPNLTVLSIQSGGLSELPSFIADMSQLTSLLLKANQLTDLPDLSKMTNLAGLVLDANAFTDIPATVGDLTSLTNFTAASNPIKTVTTDLSKLQKLTNLDLSDCDLKEFPSTILKLGTLTTLNLSYNNLNFVTGSMEEMEKLTTLNLSYNKLVEVPEGVKSAKALKTLNLSVNAITDIEDEELFKNSSALTSLNLGLNYIKYDSTKGEYKSENAKKAIAALKSVVPTAAVTMSERPLFSQLRSLDSSVGEITQIFDSEDTVRTINLAVPEDTTTITFTPTAFLEDTTVSIGDTTVNSGEDITVDGLVKGYNTINIVAYNAYDNSTVTYKLSIFAGTYVDSDTFPQEGKEYNIQLKLRKTFDDTLSMANAYFKNDADVTYENGQYKIKLTTLKNSWITYLTYRNSEGEYVQAEVAEVNNNEDTAVYIVYAENLDEALYISPYVVPMGSSPVCRIIFDTSTIVDLSTGAPVDPGEEDPSNPTDPTNPTDPGSDPVVDPSTLEDGIYSIYGEMIKLDKQDYSMANEAINHDIKLEVKDGKATVFLDFKGIEIMNMFGYLGNLYYFKEGYTFNEYGAPVGEVTSATVHSTQKDSNGNDVIDQYNDAGSLYPNLVSFPLVTTDEFIPLQVFVPIMESIGNESGNSGMGTQNVYLKLNWDTLKAADEEDFTDNQNAQQTPAVDKTDFSTGVKIYADKGVLAEGVGLSVKQIVQGADYDKAIQLLSDVGKKFKLYDISLLLDGAEVQPNGLVKVSLPIPAGYDASKLAVYRINEDGTKTLISGSVENGYYVFYVNHFSQYALVEKGSTVLDSETVKTGDSAPVAMMSVSALLALLLAGGVVVIGRRNKRKEEI